MILAELKLAGERLRKMGHKNHAAIPKGRVKILRSFIKVSGVNHVLQTDLLLIYVCIYIIIYIILLLYICSIFYWGEEKKSSHLVVSGL